jgi:hypothetical protein
VKGYRVIADLVLTGIYKIYSYVCVSRYIVMANHVVGGILQENTFKLVQGNRVIGDDVVVRKLHIDALIAVRNYCVIAYYAGVVAEKTHANNAIVNSLMLALFDFISIAAFEVSTALMKVTPWPLPLSVTVLFTTTFSL